MSEAASDPRKLRRGARLCAGLCLALFSACCLVRPPDAKTLFEAGNNGFRTPEAAFETFRAAFAADLPELEFKSLAASFRREQRISYSTYRVAREELLDDKPYLALLAEAKVVESAELSLDRHRIVAEVRGRRFEVELVREDWFQIWSGSVFLADGALDFDSAVRVSESDGAQIARAELRVPTDELAGADLSSMTSLRIERLWKIAHLGDALQGP